MPTRLLFVATCLLLSPTLILLPAQAQQSTSSSQSDNSTIEGTVTSLSRDTLVVRTDDNQFQLYTYSRGAVRPRSLARGARVRVTAGAPDENGTRVATEVTLLSSSASGTQGSATVSTGDKGAQSAPVPDKVRDVESQIKRESRRWRLGVEAGQAFNPELFMFGVQSQMGPIFSPRVMFRPNAEFDFGEVTDLVALNLEAVYRFSPKERRGEWTPFIGAGPALIFVHQSFSNGRDISFGNFDYETGFNVLAGIQARRGTFVELKTSLYSGPAPRLRVIVGYTF